MVGGRGGGCVLMAIGHVCCPFLKRTVSKGEKDLLFVNNGTYYNCGWLILEVKHCQLSKNTHTAYFGV